MLLAGNACCDLIRFRNVNVFANFNPPTIKAIAATGTSHADQLDHPRPFTAGFCVSRFSNRRLKPAGTSSIRSSP